jgi:hypothetical protein
VGVLTWFALERGPVLDSPRKRAKTFPDGSIVQRLQKSVIRAQQLELSLERLHRELLALNDQSEQQTVERLCGQRMLGAVTTLLRTCNRSDLEWNLEIKMSEKLKEFANCRHLLSIDESESKKRRWSDSDRANLGRQRNIRSRNQVIDEWLQLDCSIGHDETLEEDAYADLEDFIE